MQIARRSHQPPTATSLPSSLPPGAAPAGPGDGTRPRPYAPLVTVLLAVAAVACTLSPEWRRLCLDLKSAGLGTEPWRPFTGHLVHAGPEHLVSNLLVLIPLLLWRERKRGSLKTLGELVLLALAVAGAIRICHGGWDSYCGLSGIVYGLLTVVVLEEAHRGDRRIVDLEAPALLLVGLLLSKSILELLAGGWLFHREAMEQALGVVYLPGSHTGGMFAGLLIVGSRMRLDARPASQERVEPPPCPSH